MYETVKKSTTNVDGNLKWFHFPQNNSGGYFIEDDEVGEDVYIQAPTAEVAIKKAEELFEYKSDFCDCCGERWYYDVEDDDGTEIPKKYGEPLENHKFWFGKTAMLHHADGKVERYTFKKEFK